MDTVDRKLFKQWQAYFRVREYEQWNIAAHIAAAAWNAVVLCSGLTDEGKRALMKTPADMLKSWGRDLKRKRRAAPKPKEEAESPVLTKIAEQWGPKT